MKINREEPEEIYYDTEIRLVTAHTLDGVYQKWQIVKAVNRFMVGRRFISENTGSKAYVYWEGAKKGDFEPTWKAFAEKWKLGTIGTIRNLG